ncbi:EpsG family protein [Pectobacterium aquaticum]|uniref:EpsG family protein n=1 Tax=Pectobacterium aquaticum TaxID=2204145 RepID=UPI000E2807E1|nr:EpsG family protein [Pectobacterium aquaticum]RRN99955.1 EpsG family protein [Pectobacterium aquaticum]
MNFTIKKNNFLMFFFLFLTAAFATYISQYSNDHQAYLDLFYYNVKDYSFKRIEPGFGMFILLFNQLGIGFFSFWYLFALCALFIKYNLLIVYNTKLIILTTVLICYSISLLALHEGTQIRAALAIALGFWGVKSKNKTFSFLLLISSVMFHFSAILFFLIYFSRGVVNPNKLHYIVLMIVFSFFVPFFMSNYSSFFDKINPLFKLYYDNSEEASVNSFSFTTIFAIIFLFFNFIIGTYIKKIELTYYNSLSFSYVLSVFLLISLSFSPVLSVRLYELFSFSPFLIVTYLYSSEFESKIINIKSRTFLFYRFSLLCSLVFISAHRFIAYYFVNPIINF